MRTDGLRNLLTMRRELQQSQKLFSDLLAVVINIRQVPLLIWHRSPSIQWSTSIMLLAWFESKGP